MIADIVGINTVPETTSYVTETQDTLGRDQFLTMFLAQLKYQDPLNPMEGTEFSSQLAQFSSLEQLFSVNDNLESIKTLQDNSSRFQALDLIGKEVEADGDMLCLESDKISQGSFTLDSAAECVVRIYGQEGYAVRDIDMGALKAGSHTFEWDGCDRRGEMLDPGVYGFKITAVTGDGESLPVQTRIKGQVTRVNLDDVTPILYVGEIPITLSQVLDIRIPEVDAEEGTAY